MRRWWGDVEAHLAVRSAPRHVVGCVVRERVSIWRADCGDPDGEKLTSRSISILSKYLTRLEWSYDIVFGRSRVHTTSLGRRDRSERSGRSKTSRHGTYDSSSPMAAPTRLLSPLSRRRLPAAPVRHARGRQEVVVSYHCSHRYPRLLRLPRPDWSPYTELLPTPYEYPAAAPGGGGAPPNPPPPNPPPPKADWYVPALTPPTPPPTPMDPGPHAAFARGVLGEEVANGDDLRGGDGAEYADLRSVQWGVRRLFESAASYASSRGLEVEELLAHEADLILEVQSERPDLLAWSCVSKPRACPRTHPRAAFRLFSGAVQSS